MWGAEPGAGVPHPGRGRSLNLQSVQLRLREPRCELPVLDQKRYTPKPREPNQYKILPAQLESVRSTA